MREYPIPRLVPLLLRKIVLRAIVISNISSLTMNIVLARSFFSAPLRLMGSISLGLSILSTLVLLHHIGRLWPRKWWSVRSDLIYSTVESMFATGYLIIETILVTKFDNIRFMTAIVAFLSFWLSVSTSFAFAIWDLHVTHYSTIKSTYDFMEHHQDVVSYWTKLGVGRWPLLFGDNTLKRRFGLDRMLIRGPRAIISILCLLSMIILAYVVLIMEPTHLDGYIQTSLANDVGKYRRGNVTLQVVPVFHTEILSPELFDLEVTWRPDPQQVACRRVDGMSRVSCDVPSPLCENPPDSLIIIVNYTRALQHFSMPALKTGIHLNFNTDAPGDNQTDIDIVMDTVALPTQLYPGFHLFGTTFYSFRDTYANSRDFAFGIPHFDRYLIAHIQALIPDPEYQSLYLDNATATLRLTYQGSSFAVQSQYIVQKDQSSSSVISGFALLGGAWTFINGVFAMVFGCSLLLVLFGIKPLSMYGLVHLFQRQRALIEGGYTLSAEVQSRTIAIMREHLFDDDLNHDTEARGYSNEKDQDDEKSELRGAV